MDEVLIRNINELVQPNDVLYHLGDFSFGAVVPYREQINCKNVHLIYGNHDGKIIQNRELQKLFASTSFYKEIYIGDQHIVLSHYSFRVWNKSHRGSYQLYGHSHGSLPDDPNALSFDCGVDCTEYKPINIDYVENRMKQKVWKSIDHHGQ